MIIEVKGVNFYNKGAELMLRAIIQKINKSINDVKFAMEPSTSYATYEDRIQLGLYQKLSKYLYRVDWGVFGNFIPNKVCQLYGLIKDKEVDAIIDASGYRYGDSWKIELIAETAKKIKKWKKQGTKVILMPQAFGPFKNKKVRNYFEIILKNSDLIIARDAQSLEYINQVGNTDNVSIYPDFTNILQGEIPNYFEKSSFNFCIIPNKRMIDKTTRVDTNRYINLTTEVIKYAKFKKYNPFILIHEGKGDLEIAEVLRNRAQDVPIVEEKNPLFIKGIIGQCDYLFSSRYHGIINGLSQGVITLGTQWSHKYKYLFNDYNFPEGLIDINISMYHLTKQLNEIIDGEKTNGIREKIQQSSLDQKKQSEQMWDKVVRVLTQ